MTSRIDQIKALEDKLVELKKIQQEEDAETELVRARRLYKEAIVSLSSEMPGDNLQKNNYIEKIMAEYDQQLRRCQGRT